MSLIIEHFGDVLHEKLQKPKVACQGLLKLAYKDVFGTDFANNISFEEMQKLIDEGLKKRLEQINASDIEGIIKELQEERKKNKPIFKISGI